MRRLPACCVAIVLALAPLPSCVGGLGRGKAPPPSCTPDCQDRDCGDDGCMGVCGECGEGKACNVMAGRCIGGDEDLVTGRLSFDYRPGVIQGDGSVTLGGTESMPARNMWALVTDGDGQTLGAREILGEDGSFAVPVARRLTGDEHLVFSALWAPPPDSTIRLAVLRRNAVFDPAQPLPVWTWTRDVPSGGDAGDIRVGEQDGSGAMFLYLINRRAQDSVLESVLGASDAALVRLAILWAPNAYGYCGACYSKYTAPVVQQGEGTLRLGQAIFIDNEPQGSGAWGFPVLLHEFGHYVAENYARDDSPGGPHSLGQKLPPPFAWSEGWASFFGAMTATQWFGAPQPVYWDIQQGSSFWIDYEAGQTSDGDAIVMPTLAQGPKQELDECFVTRALWRLWEGRSGEEPDDGSGLSADAILKAVSSTRFVQLDRGYVSGCDLIDFLDAAACDDTSRIDLLKDLSRNQLHFPWDGKPLCVGGTVAGLPAAGSRDAAPARPEPPLAVDLQVREQGPLLEVRAGAVARGALPGPVRLDVRWSGPTGAGESRVVDALPGDELPRIALTLRPEALPVTVKATSRGPGGGASAQASWPPAPPPTPIAPRWRPIPPVTVSGVRIDHAVSLDPE